MTALVNNTTYGTLINEFRTWLLANCYNINTLRVPEEFKKNYTLNYLPKDSTGKVIGQGGATVTINNASAVNIISEKVIFGNDNNSGEFYNFMNARNISYKSEQIVTTSGVLNFWNNVAAFCNSHLFWISSTLTDKTYLIYKSFDSGATPYSEVEANVETEIITEKDVKAMLTELSTLVLKQKNLANITYTWEAHSSCSSSCSSSSSSSSSSSIFIGYMKLEA